MAFNTWCNGFGRYVHDQDHSEENAMTRCYDEGQWCDPSEASATIRAKARINDPKKFVSRLMYIFSSKPAYSFRRFHILVSTSMGPLQMIFT